MQSFFFYLHAHPEDDAVGSEYVYYDNIITFPKPPKIIDKKFAGFQSIFILFQ